VQALPVQLTAKQAQVARGAILDAMRGAANSYDRRRLAEAVQALASRLGSEAKRDMQRLARSGLGVASSGIEAIAWARALEALLPPSPASSYVGAIVEVLKYPTTALALRELSESASDRKQASATEYLLGKIHERFSDTRELQSDNLQATLAWIAKSYPEIDLTSPPARPALLISVQNCPRLVLTLWLLSRSHSKCRLWKRKRRSDASIGGSWSHYRPPRI
jgi:hypothetical protein